MVVFWEVGLQRFVLSAADSPEEIKFKEVKSNKYRRALESPKGIGNLFLFNSHRRSLELADDEVYLICSLNPSRLCHSVIACPRSVFLHTLLFSHNSYFGRSLYTHTYVHTYIHTRIYIYIYCCQQNPYSARHICGL